MGVGALDPVADLRRRLARAGAAPLRPLVRRWWADHGLAEHPAAVAKRIALALLEQRAEAAKRAGIVVLHDLGEQLRAADLPAFARLFATGHVATPRLVDRFGLEVLATLIARAPGRAEAARQLAQWRLAEAAAQRRAGCLAFVRIAAAGDRALPGLGELICTVCATLVWSVERADQTAVGAVLRELARAEPARVEAFVRRHARLMSRECLREAIARLRPARRAELIAHHRRATTIRR